MDMNDEIIEIFLKYGYLKIVGKNPAGDDIYRFTDLFYEEQSELVEELKLQDSDIMSSLWFKGFIDLKMDDSGTAYVYLNSRSDDWMESDSLTEEERAMMYLIYSTGYYVKEDNE